MRNPADSFIANGVDGYGQYQQDQLHDLWW